MNDDANKPEKLFCWNFQAKQDAWKSGWGGYCRQGNLSAMDERERTTGAVYVRADLVPDAQAIRDAALREAADECNRHADWIEENGRQGIYSAEGCLRTSAGNILALIGTTAEGGA